MVTLQIKIEDDLAQRIEDRAANAGCASIDQYVYELLRKDAVAVETEEHDYYDDHPDELRRLLQEGIDSGPGEPWTEADREELRQHIRERASKSGLG